MRQFRLRRKPYRLRPARIYIGISYTRGSLLIKIRETKLELRARMNLLEAEVSLLKENLARMNFVKNQSGDLHCLLRQPRN